MNLVTKYFPWVGGLFISGVFLDSLRFKFTGHPTPKHIFSTLREWSHIDLFYPAGPWVIGLGELTSSLLLIALPIVFLVMKKDDLLKKSQFFGAIMAVGIMSGAIFFHLFTPLGISTPVDWENGVPVSWAPNLFVAACFTWVSGAIIALIRKDAVLGR